MRIVGIHGIAHTYVGSAQIESEWFPALLSGLEEAGATRLQAEDFTAVAYGSLFRSPGKRSSNIPRLDATDIQTDWERALLFEWWREASVLSATNRDMCALSGEDPSIQGPDFSGRAAVPVSVQRALMQLSKSRFFRALGPERVLIFGLKQVYEYMHNLDMKQRVLQRVVEKVSSDTEIVIGHSLGSIVAYESLCQHPEWKVKMLVTLGSPLGISNLIFDYLTPAPVNGKGAWPNVEQWINIADEGDIVSLEKKLAPKFGSVHDVPVHNGWKSHSAKNYLTAIETGEAIAAVLEGRKVY